MAGQEQAGSSLGAAGTEEASACGLLAAPKPIGDSYGTRLHLRLPRPADWASEAVAAELTQHMKPQPAWVAARSTDLFMEFVAVWGKAAQPQRQKLKASVAASLALERDHVQKAFEASGVRAWRFDPVATLQRVKSGEPGIFSHAGLLTQDVLQRLTGELKGG